MSSILPILIAGVVILADFPAINGKGALMASPRETSGLVFVSTEDASSGIQVNGGTVNDQHQHHTVRPEAEGNSGFDSRSLTVIIPPDNIPPPTFHELECSTLRSGTQRRRRQPGDAAAFVYQDVECDIWTGTHRQRKNRIKMSVPSQDEVDDVANIADSDVPPTPAEVLAKVFNINIHLERSYMAVLMSFLAGYCDCLGFLAVDLFTAHITGNFSTIGMAVSNHSSTIYLKIAGLCVFALFVLVGHASSERLGNMHAPVLLGVQTTMLLTSWFGAFMFGPFRTSADKEKGGAYLTGLSLVGGMALQSTFQRKYLVGLPVTTLMTGNVVGMIFEGWNEFVTWRCRGVVFCGESSSATNMGSGTSAALRSVKNNAMAIVAFTVGCAVVTAMFVYAGHWAFLLPPIVSLAILRLGWNDLKKE